MRTSNIPEQLLEEYTSKPQVVFMFSGQGSQYYQMARELYDNDLSFRSNLQSLDQCFTDIVGHSVLDHIYDPRRTRDVPFTRMLYTHASIYMIEYALAQLFQRNGIFPDYLLGTSLGEFSAMALATSVNQEVVLEMLIEHSILCESRLSDGGGMLAVFGGQILHMELKNRFPELEIAATNFDTHFVLSGKKRLLSSAQRYLDTNKVLSQFLPVSFAYHSSQFDVLRTEFKNGIFDADLSFNLPCISCSEQRVLYQSFQGISWNITRNPIQFSETFQSFAKRGSFIFLDLGPSGTLCTFAKHIIQTKNLPSFPHAVLTPYGNDIDSLSKALRYLQKKQF